MRRRSHYLPHLSHWSRHNVAAFLVARGYRAEVKGDSVFTDAPADVITIAEQSTALED
jgi:hypothetical protein